MVDLLPTTEQREIVDSLSRYLDEVHPVGRLVKHDQDPLAATDGWAELTGQGWLAIGLPEENGGAGLATVEEALAVRLFGRVLASPLVLGTLLGARLALRAGNEALAARIAGGHEQVALAVPVGPLDLREDTVVGDIFLLDAANATLVAVIGEQGAALVERSALGDVAEVAGMDDHIGLGHVATGSFPVLHRLEGPELWHQALVLGAAYLAGICDSVCEMAASYARMRQQFGQPIGAFQAVKHRCADMAIGVEAVGSQLAVAALAVTEQRADAGFQALSAKIVAGNCAIVSAEENIQVHGAIGTTADLSAHLFLKRAHVMDMLFGSCRFLKSRLIAEPFPWGNPAAE